MKRVITILAVFLLSMTGYNVAVAQRGGGDEKYEKIKAALVSFYTEQMDLNSDQAVRFWPLHNEYETERRRINREIIRLKKSANPNELSKIEKLEKQRFELRNKYKSRFLDVISPAQLSKMYKAEEDFREMLRDKMKD